MGLLGLSYRYYIRCSLVLKIEGGLVRTVRGHGRFENLGRLLRLPGFRKIFVPNGVQFTSKAEFVHLAPTRASVLLAT